MKYTPLQYAYAFYGALKDASAKERSVFTKRFLELLARHKANGLLPRILRALKSVERGELGVKDYRFESADPISLRMEKKIRAVLPKNARAEFVVNREVLAGVAISINDEILIDATAERHLDRLIRLEKNEYYES